MMRSRRGKGKKLADFKSFEDVERMAQMIMAEAKTSLAVAGRIMGKLIVVSVLGFTLASNCCLSRYLVPIGVLMLAIAAGWLDAIGNECRCDRFFPYKRLNSMGASFYRWQWVVFWAVTIFAICVIQFWASEGIAQLLRFGIYDLLWKVCMMVVAPLTLMLIGRKLEPFRFRSARADIQKAEMLVRQLAATQTASDISALAPLIEPDLIPFYKLGSIAELLYNFVANHEATDKLKVDISARSDSKHSWLSLAYAPFRMIASDLLLWESRDLVLYIVAALYAVLVYVGSFYFEVSWYFPLCVLVPFMGPKSRAARYARKLQENIRLAQGASAEKKGGLTPAWIPEECLAINWPMVVYIGGTHLTAIYAIVVLFAFGGVCPLLGNGNQVKWQTGVLTFVLYLCAGLGITAGVHRLWAHRSYKAGTPLRLVLMIFNSIANQGSIYHWARDHRVHHLYSDTAADPHDANRGFWFSHVGWLLFKKSAAVIEAGKKINMRDLQSDAIVMFQKKADPFWNLIWCFAFPSFTVLAWGDSFWHGFLFAGVLRYAALLNATWAVNSVVHAIGVKPYNPSHLTTENGWVSLFAIGEGWHNWHHAFSWDYAAAELEPWQQFNPTKVFIDAMATLGFAWDRKRALDVWRLRKERWAESQGREVLESLEGPPFFKQRVVTFGPAYEDDDHVTNDSQSPEKELPCATSDGVEAHVQ
jgi:stearoyl-CoA desaturase (delta-9 desaturase)